jgi:hypothetical protein
MRFLSISAALLGIAGIAVASKVVDLDTNNFDQVGRTGHLRRLEMSGRNAEQCSLLVKTSPPW